MLTLSQACSHSTKGFTQLLPPGPCSTSSSYHPASITSHSTSSLKPSWAAPSAVHSVRSVCTEGCFCHFTHGQLSSKRT